MSRNEYESEDDTQTPIDHSIMPAYAAYLLSGWRPLEISLPRGREHPYLDSVAIVGDTVYAAV